MVLSPGAPLSNHIKTMRSACSLLRFLDSNHPIVQAIIYRRYPTFKFILDIVITLDSFMLVLPNVFVGSR